MKMMEKDLNITRSCQIDCRKIMKMIEDVNVVTVVVKGSLGGETSVLRTFRMSGK